MTSRAKITAAISAGLGAVALLIFLGRETPSSSAYLVAPISTARPVSDRIPETIEPVTAKAPGESTQEIVAGEPLPVAAAIVEVPLPPPPSGDYDLNLSAEQVVALVEKRYGGLFPTLRVLPRDLARLRSLLVERQQATIDGANAAVLSGLHPVRDLPTIREVINRVEADSDASIRQELGESVFAAFSTFDRTSQERNSAADLARLLAPTAEPLRPEQESRLIQILGNSAPVTSPTDIDRAVFGEINTRARISPQAIAAAAAVLSPVQLERLRRLQEFWISEDARHAPDSARVN